MQEKKSAPASRASTTPTVQRAASWKGQVRSDLRGASFSAGQAALQPQAPGLQLKEATEDVGAAAVAPEPAAQEGTAAQAAGGGATAAAAAAAETPVAITLGSNAVVSAAMIETLKDICRTAGITSASITSGRRTSTDQARIMYDNLETYGAAHQHALYGSGGDAVIDVYETEKAASKTETEIRAAMEAKITELGPSTVSKHCSDTHDVIDVDPNSVSNDTAFIAALATHQANGDITSYILPPADPAYHIVKAL